jgi:hypothetical protein
MRRRSCRLTAGSIVAIDVAKTRFVAVIATVAGEVVKLVKFEHPRQTEIFLKQVSILGEAGHIPSVVMEPTGNVRERSPNAAWMSPAVLWMGA